MKKVKLIGGVCLTVILVVSLCAVPAFADEESESGPLPPSITPVVILQGSDYEMGYQYGQQAGQYIEMEKSTTPITNKVLHELKAGQWYIIQYAPEEIEMMKGIADGSSDAGYPLSYIDVLMLNEGRIKPNVYPYPEEAEGYDLPPEECSVFSAWGSATKDRSLICGDSVDTGTTHQLHIVAFPEDEDSNSYITTARAGQLSRVPGMNNKGVFQGVNGGFGRRDIDRGYGLPYPCECAHLIRFANSAAEAKDMLLSWQLPGAKSFQFSDVGGNAFVVEFSAAFKAVREPGEYGTGEEEYGEDTNFIYSANNYFSDEGGLAILAEKWIEHAGWLGRSASISSIPRNLEMWNMLHNYQGEVDLEFAKMMWRFQGAPPPEGSLYPTDPAVKEAYYDTQGEGWDQKIGNLDTAWLAIALPDDGDEGVMYICTGPAAKVAYILAPGAAYYQIEGTHTFYELTLASSPRNVVSAAKTAAHAYIAEAYHELMWLNYTDTGYTGLNELYSTANAEYYEGINWTNKAALAKGDEALAYYAKAATAFTRSQAHAKQVYNALVPPATCPKDLGLKRYKEPKWEVTEVGE